MTQWFTKNQPGLIRLSTVSTVPLSSVQRKRPPLVAWNQHSTPYKKGSQWYRYPRIYIFSLSRFFAPNLQRKYVCLLPKLSYLLTISLTYFSSSYSSPASTISMSVRRRLGKISQQTHFVAIELYGLPSNILIVPPQITKGISWECFIRNPSVMPELHPFPIIYVVRDLLIKVPL